FPVASADLDEDGFGPFRPFGRIVSGIEIAMPFEQVFVSAEQEGARAASRIQDLEFGRLFWCFAFEKLNYSGLDDVINDVSGSVINATRFFDFGFFFDQRTVAFRETDDFAEKLLVHLAEDVGWEGGEDVR